jgi:hypothetical protein
MTVLVHTTEELRAILIDAAKEGASLALSNMPPQENQFPEFMTKLQARQYIGGLSQPTFDKLVASRAISPCDVSEGRLVFWKEDLKTYLLSKKRSR